MINPTQTPEYQKLLATAREAASGIAASGHESAAKELNDLIAVAANQQFTLGVVGEAKRGKSTLINALLGRTDDKLAPVDSYPATAVTSVFSRADTESAAVIYAANPDKPVPTSFDQIRSFVCEEGNPKNAKGVRAVRIAGPFPSLEPGVNLVDTPGAGNALSDVHDTVLLEFLPNADALIFLVSANAPLTQSELDLLRCVRKQDVRKLFFVVNKADNVDADELEEALAHNRKVLAAAGFPDAPIFPISAKKHFLTQGDEGTRRLLDAITALIRNDRVAVMTQKLRERLASLLTATGAELKNELDAGRMTVGELETEREQLAGLRDKLRNERGTYESRFRAQWNSAHNGFMDELRPVCRSLQKDYGQVIQDTPDRKLGELAKIIHTDIAAKVVETLRPAMDRLEAERTGALEHLQSDYKSFVTAGTPDIAPVATAGNDFGNAAKIVLAGAPTALAAWGVSLLPGIVGSSIAATVPAAVAPAGWAVINPFAWGGYFVGSAAHGAAGAAGIAAGGTLATVATVACPVLFAFAAYKVYGAWKSGKIAERNKLTHAADKLIEDAFSAIHDQAMRMRNSGEEMLNQFHLRIDEKLGEMDARFAHLQKNRPDPKRLLALEDGTRRVTQALESLK